MVAADFQLRGAPADWMRSIESYAGPVRVRETLICGGGGTGKSFGTLLVIYYLCCKYPGIRVLLCRHTRDSMSESTLVEWEKILEAYGEETKNQTRQHRSVYRLKSGALVAIGGLNDPQRLYSTSWSIIYYEELTEENDSGPWEEFRRGARSFSHKDMRELLLIATCNPREQSHWLYQRSHGGPMEYLESKLEHNPVWHNGADWTPEGRAYIESLDQLTGVRHRRLRLGEWCAAEGMVWDEWSEETHTIEAPLINSDGDIAIVYGGEKYQIHTTFAAMDWGFSDPCVLQVWGLDGERRMWRLAEIYRQGLGLDWWTDRVAEFYREFNLRCVVVDPSRPEAIESFNRRIAFEGGYSNINAFAFGADNRRGTASDYGGIEAVRSQMVKRGDALPGMVFLKYALRFGADPVLKTKHYPLCTEDEIPAYIYFVTKDGRPNRDATDPRCRDHGCDAMRYATKYARDNDFRTTPLRKRYRSGTLGALLRDRGKEILWPK